MLERIDLNKTYQFLLVILAFLMPITVAGANIIVVFICFLWLFSGNYKSKFYQISSNKLMLASIAFFSLHVVGLAWTEDLSWGLHIVHKMWYFLLFFPILYTIVSRKYITYYISAFLLAMSITEILSYLIWFEVILPFKNATAFNPTPFMSHVSYNPILAFAIYLVLHKILITKNLGKFQLFLFIFFAISMSINMFITGGRAGYIMYFVMLGILSFQYYNFNKIKALFAALIIVPVVFFSAYQTSIMFNERVDRTYENITNYSENKTSSVGQRITYAINSWDIIKQSPFIGVGTGDFPVEYKKMNMVNTPSLINTTNPHNMYILVLVQLGLLGLASLLSIFYYQMKFSFYASNRLISDVGFTLPALFLVIMWSDAYLLGHFTTLMFVFFSSFLHKNFEKP